VGGSWGELIGLAWLEEPDGVVMQVRPALRGHGSVEKEMLGWAAERLADPGRNPDGELWTRALLEDTKLDVLLIRLGFERDQDHALKMHQALDTAIPEPELPEGWTVRPMDGEQELEKRLEIHHAVWPSSRMTTEAHRNLREAPGYTPSLDLVAAGPDGAFGEYCLCWLARRSEQDRPVRALRHQSCPSAARTRPGGDDGGSAKVAGLEDRNCPRDGVFREPGSGGAVRVGRVPNGRSRTPVRQETVRRGWTICYVRQPLLARAQ
jgi:hypothetical protein